MKKFISVFNFTILVVLILSIPLLDKAKTDWNSLELSRIRVLKATGLDSLPMLWLMCIVFWKEILVKLQYFLLFSTLMPEFFLLEGCRKNDDAKYWYRVIERMSKWKRFFMFY